MTLQVQSPFQQFFDTDGDPLDNGSIYIGQPNLNPQQYPAQVFWDQAGTIPALQPIKTLNGYAVRNGTPARIFIENADYSITVRDSRGRLIFTALSVTAVTYNLLAGPNGSSFIGFIQPESGAVAITVQDKLRQRLSVKDFGAKGDGVTNDLPFIAAMAASVGYVIFTHGNYAITAGSIAVPIIFEDDAYLTLPAANTFIMSNRITSNNQWVFRGDGDYLVNIVTPNGEDARDLRVEWFGVFPTNNSNVDVAPKMQKALNALGGQAREGTLRFPQGSFHMSSGVTVPRGVHVVGGGTRRTVFDISGDGYVPFTSAGDAVKFTDFQFEQPAGSIFARNSAYIQISHTTCEIYRIWLWPGMNGIIVDGSNCTIADIFATYGVSMPAGSSGILVRSSGCTIDGFKQNTSAFGPDAMVEIGGASAANTGFARVTNIQHACPSISVLLNASTFNVTRINIENIVYAGLSGTASPGIVKTITAGATTISHVVITNLNANNLAGNLVRIEQNSSGITEDIVIDNSIIDGSTGSGIEFVRTAGTLRNILVGDTVDVSERATPFLYSGSMTNIRTSPQITPSANSAFCYGFTIANDSVAIIDPHKSIFTGVGILTGNSATYGQFFIRAAATPNIIPMFPSTANVDVLAAALTGTTGTIGKMTIGVQPGLIYIENRLGVSQSIHFSVLAP